MQSEKGVYIAEVLHSNKATLIINTKKGDKGIYIEKINEEEIVIHTNQHETTYPKVKKVVKHMQIDENGNEKEVEKEVVEEIEVNTREYMQITIKNK